MFPYSLYASKIQGAYMETRVHLRPYVPIETGK